MDLSTLSLSQTDLKIMNQPVEKVVKVEMVMKEVKEVKMVVLPEEKVVLPSLRPVFFSTLMVVSHLAIKSFDLVMALTGGGPGTSSDVPAIFMYQFAFTRGQLGQGAASAMMMLFTIVAVLVPLMYLETRSAKRV